MQYWVLKGNPRDNDWDSMLVPGYKEKWHTGRGPKDWAVGDRLFCWESTPKLRMIGLATLIQTDCGLDDDGDLLFEVQYLTRRFASMLGIDELRQVPVLHTASFLKTGPATTVFPLTSEQADILLRILITRNPDIARVWPDLNVEPSPAFLPDLDMLAYSEGTHKWMAHFVRERNRTLVEKKKRSVLNATGVLTCEVCGFDFAKSYGPLGEDFCEVHHRKPLADADEPVETRLEDLAIVCSNCHRMLHRRRSTAVSVEELRSLVNTCTRTHRTSTD